MPSQDFLRRIIAAANSIKEQSEARLDAALLTDSPLPNGIDLSRMRISPAASILQALLADGVPDAVAYRLSERLDKTLLSLQENLEDNFLRTWLKILGVPRHNSMRPLHLLREQLEKAYQSLYNSKASEWANEIKRMAMNRSRVAQHIRMSSEASERPAFNPDYIPVLEAFFSEEQFPSRSDKLFLAKKSGMTFRQIHVWFQNRRSRTKRLVTVDQTFGGNSSSSTDTEVEDNGVSETFSRSSSFTFVDDTSFALATTPYTFPTKYPPDLDPESDPYPCRYGDFTSFQKPTWERVPVATRTLRNAPDINSMIEAFASLKISANSDPKIADLDPPRAWGLPSRRIADYDITLPCTIRPPKAPLPSLIRNASHRIGLRPCIIFRPSECNIQSSLRKPLRTVTKSSNDGPTSLYRAPSPVALSSSSSTYVSASHQVSASGTTQARTSNKDCPKQSKRGPKKKSGLPRRVPIGLPNKRGRVEIEASVSSLALPLYSVMDESSSRPTFSSDDIETDISNLTSTSRSSSEAHSPSTPPLLIPENFPSLQIPPEGLGSLYDLHGLTSQNEPTSLPPPIFASSDCSFDLFSKQSTMDQFSSFLPTTADPLSSLGLPTDDATPTPFPFVYDFMSLSS